MNVKTILLTLSMFAITACGGGDEEGKAGEDSPAATAAKAFCDCEKENQGEARKKCIKMDSENQKKFKDNMDDYNKAKRECSR